MPAPQRREAETGREGIGGDVTVLDWIGQQWLGDELSGKCGALRGHPRRRHLHRGGHRGREGSLLCRAALGCQRGVLALYQAGGGDPYEGGAILDSHPADEALGDDQRAGRSSHTSFGEHVGAWGATAVPAGSSQHPGSERCARCG